MNCPSNLFGTERGAVSPQIFVQEVDAAPPCPSAPPPLTIDNCKYTNDYPLDLRD